MKRVPLSEANTKLSAIVLAAENGEPAIITKEGRPVAMIVPMDQGRKLYPEEKPSFAEWLLSIPAEIPVERSRSRVRKVEF